MVSGPVSVRKIFGTLLVLALVWATFRHLPASPEQTGRFLFRQYNTQDGMTQDQAVSLFQDSAGQVWIGTYGGLSCYDGVAFHNFTQRDGLPDSVVSDIFQDRDGRIWVGAPHGVAFLDGGRFVGVPLPLTSENTPIHGICQTPGGAMVFGTTSGLLVQAGGGFRRLTRSDGLPSDQVHSLCASPKGDVLVGTSAGLAVLSKDGKVAPVPGLGSDPVVDVSADARSGLVMLTRPFKVTLWARDGTSSDWRPETPEPAELLCSRMDGRGTLWVASQSDGVWFQPPGGPASHISEEEGLEEDGLLSMLVDYEDSLWVGCNAKLVKLTNRSLRVFRKPDGLSTLSWCAIPDGDSVLVGTEHGWQRIRGSGMAPPEWKEAGGFLDIARFGDEYWVGTTGGVVRIAPGEPHRRAVSGPEGRVWRVLPVGDEEALVGGNDGLWVGKFPEFRRIPFPAGQSRRSVNDLIRAGENTWWVGTSRGFLALERKGASWAFGPRVVLGDSEVQCFARANDGCVWVGTIGMGAFLLDGAGDPKKPLPIAESRGLNNIWALEPCRGGGVWIGSGSGLWLYKNGVLTDFNARFGLPKREISSCRAICTNERGDVVFSDGNGVNLFDQSQEPARTPPRAAVTAVLVNGLPVGLNAGAIRLNHDDSVTVQFQCCSFSNESENRFQYRLGENDRPWSAPAKQNFAYYPYLPTGENQFQLRAANSLGVVSELVFSAVFSVSPPFTRTAGFFLLVTGGLVLLAGAFVAAKVRSHRREKERLRVMVKEKTAELRSSEEKYRQLVDCSMIGISILQDGLLVFVNPHLAKCLRVLPEELVGRGLRDAVHEDDRASCAEMEALAETGDSQPHEYEVRLRTGDGSVKVFLVEAAVTLFDSRPATLLNMVDITEKKRLQEQLLHYQKLESIGTLAGGIAHDFNNIMQGITGLTSLVRLQLPDDSPVQSDLVMIEEATCKAAVLTRKLLGFARKGKYVVSRMDIHEVLGSVSAFSLRTIPLNIEFVSHFHPGPLVVQGDRNQLEQVFLNLYLNARDAMPSGGAINTSTGVVIFDTDQDKGDHVIQRGEYVCIRVSDTGTGISPDVLPLVFDPFFTTKPQEKGSGLGLATVYGIIKNHMGFIYAESEVGLGTTFTVLLPRSSKAVDPAPAGHLLGAPLDTRILDGKGVLIVEDEAINRQFLRKLLTQAGMVCFEAENGLHGVHLFRARHQEIDVVLMDVNMPVMDGREALRQLLAVRPDASVLILSGYGEDVKIREMLDGKGRDFIQKPINASQLLEKMVSILHSAAAKKLK